MGGASPTMPYDINGSMEKVFRSRLWRRGSSECLIVRYAIQRVNRAIRSAGTPMAMATTTSTESVGCSAIDSYYHAIMSWCLRAKRYVGV